MHSNPFSAYRIGIECAPTFVVVNTSSAELSVVGSLFPFPSRKQMVAIEDEVALIVLQFSRGFESRSSSYLRADKPYFSEASSWQKRWDTLRT